MGARQGVQKREKREKSCREVEHSVLGRTQNSQDPRTSSSQPGSQTPVRPEGLGWVYLPNVALLSPHRGETQRPQEVMANAGDTPFLLSSFSSQYFWLLSGPKVLPSTILIYLLRERNILLSPQIWSLGTNVLGEGDKGLLEIWVNRFWIHFGLVRFF